MSISTTLGAEDVITGELPPYSSSKMKNNGDLTQDILTTLNKIGYKKIKLSYQPWPRGLKNMTMGNAIAAFPFTWTSSRSKHLYFSVPIAFDIQSWYTTHDKKYLEQSSWKGKVACVPKGWFSDAINDVVYRNQLNVRTTNRLNQCLELLKKGRVDLVSISDKSRKTHSLNSESNLYRLSLYRQNVTFYLVTPKNAEGKARIGDFNDAWIGSNLPYKWY